MFRTTRCGARGDHRDFPTTDVAFVIGANDVTNPAPRPIQEPDLRHADPRRRARQDGAVHQALDGDGYAGVDNELFFRDNTMMLFGDAKKVTEALSSALD